MKKRCTLLRHESCFVYNHDRAKSQNHAHFLPTRAEIRAHCIVTTRILLLPQWAPKRAAVVIKKKKKLVIMLDFPFSLSHFVCFRSRSSIIIIILAFFRGIPDILHSAR